MNRDPVEVCLGCGQPTAKRDCGCPAGTAMQVPAAQTALYGRASRTGGIGPGHWRRSALAEAQEMAAANVQACTALDTSHQDMLDRKRDRSIVGDIVARAWTLHYADVTFADTVTLCLPLLP